MPKTRSLQELMKDAGITQGQLAAESGVHPTTISLAFNRKLALAPSQEEAIRKALVKLSDQREKGVCKLRAVVGDLRAARELAATEATG
jgi:transcriptional regulator with XRE-family HTH domain